MGKDSMDEQTVDSVAPAHDPAPIVLVGFMAGIPAVLTSHYTSAMRVAATTAHVLATQGKMAAFAFPTTTDHAQARNALADTGLAYGTEYVFFGDCDQTFDPTTVLRMMEVMNAGGLDVLTGVYFMRGNALPVLYRLDEGKDVGKGGGQQGFKQIVRYPKDGIFAVGGCGGGCLMVRTSTFAKMRDVLGRRPFDNRIMVGVGWIMEDLSFALNCHELGVSIWCDPTIVSGHLVVKEVTDTDNAEAKYAGETIVSETSIMIDGNQEALYNGHERYRGEDLGRGYWRP